MAGVNSKTLQFLAPYGDLSSIRYDQIFTQIVIHYRNCAPGQWCSIYSHQEETFNPMKETIYISIFCFMGLLHPCQSSQ